MSKRREIINLPSSSHEESLFQMADDLVETLTHNLDIMQPAVKETLKG